MKTVQFSNLIDIGGGMPRLQQRAFVIGSRFPACKVGVVVAPEYPADCDGSSNHNWCAESTEFEGGRSR
jgi:hypothetical protein